jgi:hypothetical protein
MLIVPAIFTSALLLLVICWRELFLRPLPLLCIAGGLLVGAFPLIYYNLNARPGQDSLTVLRALDTVSSQNFKPTALKLEIGNTFQISLPLMTGEPFCPVTEIPFLGPTSEPTLACTLARGSWSAGYILLFVCSGLLTIFALGSPVFRRKTFQAQSEWQPRLRVELGRLMLLASAALTLIIYTFSNSPVTGPGLHARYLICLLAATPVVYWPLWLGLTKAHAQLKLTKRSLQVICASMLICFCGLGVLGSGLTFVEVPATSVLNQNDLALIHTLEQMKIRHVYTDYWTCDKLAFESNEQVTCVVLSNKLQVSSPHYNRYYPYVGQVVTDPQSAYLLPLNKEMYNPVPADSFIDNPALPFTDLPLHFRVNYTRTVANGYIIYQPRKQPALELSHTKK